MRGIALAMLGACSYTGPTTAGIDATGSIDANPNAPDANLTLPDAPVGAPDARVGAPDAAPSMTRVFQNGLNGYTGTVDTYIQSSASGTAHGTLTTVILDDDTSIGGEQRYGLFRFDQVFGPGAAQVPVGATIVSAALAVVVVQQTATVGTVGESAITWDESTTWDGFGAAPGVQPGDVGAVLGAGPSSGTYVLDVTASVTVWATNPTLDHGWIFAPGGTDGCDLASSETGTAANRPMLTVVFLPP